MSRKTYEIETFVRPNQSFGRVVDLSESCFAAAKVLPEGATLSRGRIRPDLVWGKEGVFYRKAESLLDCLCEGLWGEGKEHRKNLHETVAFVIRSFFDPTGDRLAFGYATPSKSLASRAAAKGLGILKDDGREPPKFLEHRVPSFKPGFGIKPLMVGEWALFRASNLERDGKSRPEYVQLDGQRRLILPGGEVSPYYERTLCMAVEGRDDAQLRSGRIPGVERWHDNDTGITSLPFLAFGVIHEYSNETFVTDILLPLNPGDASVIHYTARYRPFATFLETTPVARQMLIQDGIIHEPFERPWPSRYSEN
jgi:hypothetical protein